MKPLPLQPATAECSLIAEHAFSANELSARSLCRLGVNYGCYANGERKMWVSLPCHGRFRCAGVDVRCGMVRMVEKFGRRHNCTCYEYEVLEARADGSSSSAIGAVPAELAETRLVDSASIKNVRFVPKTTDEVLHATFAMWNLLDRMMLEHSNSNFQRGYLQEVQLRRMVQLARAPAMGTYCEVGMNGGHSAVAMLHANPSLRVHTFDIMFWNYSWPIAHLLRTLFGGRFTLHSGDSRDSVPAWAASHHGLCNLVLVDGDHTPLGAERDLRNLRAAAAPNATVVVDDTAVGPGEALSRLSSTGAMRVRERFGPYDAPSGLNKCMPTVTRGTMCLPWGFSVAEYLK